MAITALPATTRRILGAPTVIVTPLSLLKELIDNAIDAGATHIEASISPNTVDKIEMKDNGHGISHDDLDKLGRRGHTSKLSGFEDLETIGGTSLGFRGEALAAAAAIGKVTITTKPACQPVAVSMQLRKGGGVECRRPASAPNGTMVTVTDLYACLPVRKRVVIREASKLFPKIRTLLCSYVMARPQLRFSFKVFSRDASSWVYSPNKHGVVVDAVSQIIGARTGSQCIEKIVKDDELPSDSKNIPHTGHSRVYVIEAVLVVPDADLSKISHGSFFSVDSRPISPSGKTTRKLISAYRCHVLAQTSLASVGSLLTPFIRVNIKCPPGSYDPNVEPSKDDVIFTEEQHILDLFAILLEETYGPIDEGSGRRLKLADKATPGDITTKVSDGNLQMMLDRHASSSPSQESHRTSDTEFRGVDLNTETTLSGGVHAPLAPSENDRAVLQEQPKLLNSRAAAIPAGANLTSSPTTRSFTHAQNTVHVPVLFRDIGWSSSRISLDWRVDMSASNEESNPCRLSRADIELAEDAGNMLDPWVIAKHSSVRSNGRARTGATSHGLYHKHDMTDSPRNRLLAEQSNRESAVRVLDRPDPLSRSDTVGETSPEGCTTAALGSTTGTSRPGTANTDVQQGAPIPTRPSCDPRDSTGVLRNPPSLSGYDAAGDMVRSLGYNPLSSPKSDRDGLRQSRLSFGENGLRCEELRKRGKATSHSSSGLSASQNQQGGSVGAIGAASSQHDIDTPQPPFLVEKEPAALSHYDAQEISQGQGGRTRSHAVVGGSPALHEATVLPPRNGPVYARQHTQHNSHRGLLCGHSSIGMSNEKEVCHVKTGSLPLEQVPQGQETQMLVIRMTTTEEMITRSWHAVVRYDSYANEGFLEKEGVGTAFGLLDSSRLETSLAALMHPRIGR